MPVWLWRADLASRSLHFVILSQTPLQPLESETIPDLAVTIGNTKIAAPFLTVLELLNDGSRPVPSNDFESPIEILADTGVNIVRARVTNANPKDIMVELATEPQSVILKPFLINPGDSVTIAVLTEGKSPVFRSRARISGISSVPIIDSSEVSKSPILSVLAALGALLSLVASSTVINAWPSKGGYLRPRAAFLIYAVGSFAGAFLIMFMLSILGIAGFWAFIATFGVASISAVSAANWLNAPTASGEKDAKDAA